MKNIIQSIILSIIVSSLFSCNEGTKQEPKTDNSEVISTEMNKYSDDELVSIYNFCDKREFDSLVPYLNHSNDAYRYEAVMACASFSNISEHLETIYPLLSDKSSDVRSAAAWSIGQFRENQSFNILKNSLFDEKESSVRTNIWEALGKTIDEKNISFFENYELNNGDSLGYSKGLYQIVLQKIQTELIISRLIGLCKSDNQTTRLYVANSLARNHSISLNKYTTQLISAISNETNDDCKMAFISSLRNTDNIEPIEYIESILKNGTENYSILINCLRAYSNKEELKKGLIIKYLLHNNENLALTAAKTISKTKLSKSQEEEIYRQSKDYRPSVRAEIARMLLKNNPNGIYAEFIKNEFNEAESVYEKAFYLRSLAVDNREIPFLSYKMLSSKDAPISSAAIESLIELKENNWPNDSDFEEIIERGFLTGDVTIIGMLASHIRNEEYGYKQSLNNYTFIQTAREKLELPKEIETYNELLKTEAFFAGTEVDIPSPEWNHPINWEKVKTIKPNQQVKINTSSGSFIMEMKVEDSPGSVVNFIQLAEEGYFDGKYFHRVVPNFVIQTGCPRGDGWGSVPYSIRSEFSLHNYKTGAVGMASAGSDTESCQWFVCHSPTLHLEGRYTIFAYVVEGMKTVHKVQVGTIITSVEIL